ncbi:putative glycosyltransferase [Metallosphaera yellowstonensis MK1]|uniref:Putative glycosyltransferase n=1 Tax=Metallosphaera yellowstonensis MK1 TaxID=671065 RepID=H2C0T6_9CREN|nr:putative glycosyltransferase [Metallosphaera yellowstonensis MK1]
MSFLSINALILLLRFLLVVEEIPIIVVNYNGIELLKKYLDSVLQTQYPSKVVVVDNGSKDGSVEYLKKIRS